MAPRESAADKEAREAQEAADAAVAAAAASAQGSVDVDDDAKRVRVKVDQLDGEIVLTRGGTAALTKSVTDGHVVADNADELAVLLASVPGATRVED